MDTLFNKSQKGKRCASIRPLRVGEWRYKNGRTKLDLPELSEVDLAKHYYELDSYKQQKEHTPLMSETISCLKGFKAVHPLQSEDSTQGYVQAFDMLTKLLIEITGFETISLASSFGCLEALWLVDEFFKTREDINRRKVVVTDESYKAVVEKSGFVPVVVNMDEGDIDLNNLANIIDKETAAIMMGNFERDIEDVKKIVHGAGALMVYEGARLGEIMGIVRPFDMGFDVACIDLGALFKLEESAFVIACKKDVGAAIPVPFIVKDKKGNCFWQHDSKTSIGRTSPYYGNAAAIIKALAYILTLGGDGLKETTQIEKLINQTNSPTRPKVKTKIKKIEEPIEQEVQIIEEEIVHQEQEAAIYEQETKECQNNEG
ncbi:MAG: hypothetical protein FWE03_03440 [Firmicutes bacterium]|nr:hypothetical protein [Bacillota bacterium]